jgi:hypothetical protein
MSGTAFGTIVLHWPCFGQFVQLQYGQRITVKETCFWFIGQKSIFMMAVVMSLSSFLDVNLWQEENKPD